MKYVNLAIDPEIKLAKESQRILTKIFHILIEKCKIKSGLLSSAPKVDENGFIEIRGKFSHIVKNLYKMTLGLYPHLIKLLALVKIVDVKMNQSATANN